MPDGYPDTEHRLVLGLAPDGLEDLDLGWRIWGWRTRPSPHAPVLHIYACTPIGRLAVLLEGPTGVRCFQPDPRLPLAVVMALRAELEAERAYAEACWASDIVLLGWIGVAVVPDTVVITVYRGTENEFTVRVEVEHVTSASLEGYDESAWVVAVVGEHEIPMALGRLLWRSE